MRTLRERSKLRSYRSKVSTTRVSGQLWRVIRDGKSRRYYEYDRNHGGEIEVYNRHGIPIGVQSAKTGRFIKPSRKEHSSIDGDELSRPPG